MKMRLNRLDVAALGTAALLSLLILLVLGLGNPVQLSLNSNLEQTGGFVSPLGPLTLRFSRAVQVDLIAAAASFEPPVAGTFIASDPQTVEFWPAKPLQPGVKYSIRLAPAALGQNGERLRREWIKTLRAREPLIVYMTIQKDNRELFSVDLQGKNPRQLTHTNNRIFDYAVSPNGDWIAYTVVNDQKGVDLWLLNRDGSQSRRLLDCGAGQCEAPAWSPDGRQIAYTRKLPGLETGAAPGLPRPWLIDLSSGITHPVYADQQILGYGSIWSPDGKWLGTIDSVTKAIHFLNLVSGQEVIIPSNTGALPSWSPDSRTLWFTTVEKKGEFYQSTVQSADFETGEIAVIFGDDPTGHDYAYGSPVWSPGGGEANPGGQVLISYRPGADSPARRLWSVNPTTLEGPLVAAEKDTSYDFYHWDPWGEKIVFQRVRLGAVYNPEVILWRPGEEHQLLASSASFPQWLP